MANRIRMAFLKSSLDIVGENPETPDHASRSVLAQKIISGQGVPPNVHAVLALRSPDAIQIETPTDTQIQDAVNGNFTYLALNLGE